MKRYKEWEWLFWKPNPIFNPFGYRPVVQFKFTQILNQKMQTVNILVQTSRDL